MKSLSVSNKKMYLYTNEIIFIILSCIYKSDRERDKNYHEISNFDYEANNLLKIPRN